MILKRAYSIKKPEHFLLDIDTTLLDGYGKQEGICFNYHYQASGYHPFICFDSITGDLVGTQLRGESDYFYKNVSDFLEPILNEYLNKYKARYQHFKLCSSCPFKDAFYETLRNITWLTPLIE